MSQPSIKIPSFAGLKTGIMEAVEKGVNDATDDLLRVASLRAPVDSTTLEKQGTSKVGKSGSVVKGQVSFSAINKGYNYAKRMDVGTYKLGAKSIIKSSRGARSTFSKKTFKVGTGYLTNTAEECKEGYEKHIEDLISKEIANCGFGK